MIRLRWCALLALVTAAACGGETTVVSIVSTVTISPASPTVEVGLAYQLTAEARGSSGQVLDGQSFEWTSLSPSIASIDGNGLVTGLTPGQAEITASTAGVTDRVTLTVTGNPCETSRVNVILAVYESAAFDSDECLFLPSGTAGDLYRVTVARPTLIEDETDTATVTLRVDPVVSAAPPQVPEGPSAAPERRARVRGGIDGTGSLERVRMQERTLAFHIGLRQRERELDLGPDALLPSRPALAGPLRAHLPAPPSSRTMYLDLDCSVTNLQPVTLIDFDDNLAIYQDDVSHADMPLTTVATAQLKSYYASYVLDMIQDYWGPMPDIDGNGRLIVVTSSALDESAAAAVYSGDLVSSAFCASSNGAEVMYFQREVLAQLEAMDPSYGALSILAHEAKHVTSLYNGIQRGAFNEIWIEEGTAEISQVMSSRIAWAATGGPPLGTAITGQDIVDAAVSNGGTATPEMSGVVDAVAGLVLAMNSHPNSLIVQPDGASPDHSFYSPSWHWHRFLGDAIGGASVPLADTTFFRTLHDPGSPGGIVGEEALVGSSFEEIFDDLMIAVNLHGSGGSPTRDFTTWDFITATDVFSAPPALAPDGVYPWPVTTQDDNTSYAPFTQATYEGVMGPSGMRVYDFQSSGSGSGIQLRVSGAIVPGPSGPLPGRIVITRLD